MASVRGYLRALLGQWIALVGGAVPAVAQAIAEAAKFNLPRWFWIASLVGGLLVAHFLAWRKERTERDVARTEIAAREAMKSRLEFHHETLRLVDVVSDDSVYLPGRRFEECVIRGPAFLVPTGHGSMIHCNFIGGEHPDDLIITIPDRVIVGAIVAVDCDFVRCRFEGVGLLGPDELRETMRREMLGVRPSPPL